MEFNDYPENLSDDTIPMDPIPPVEEPDSDGFYHSAYSEPSPESGIYRNTGAGRKESPFADSPYESSFQPSSGDTAHKTVKQKKEKKAPSGIGRKIAAGAAALALIIGSCAVTAGLVNRRWEDRTAQLEQTFQRQLNQMQAQIAQAGNTGISVSGTVSTGGLSTTQVYAQNVNSVVAVSNYVTVTDRWGTSTGGTALAGTGSGFIISEDGYVMTNYHVVEGAEKLTVTTHLGEEYDARLIGSDEINDVALLKVDADGLDPVEIGSSDDLLVGDMVIAIGNPLGELTSTATVGYVSGKDRSVTTDGTMINMLQTDAAINSGNSGGPLFNMKGQVIGITTAKYSGTTGSGASIEGIGFAIPIDDVVDKVQQIKDNGYVSSPYMGVTVDNRNDGIGAYVVSVEENSGAAQAGIRPGDIIVELGGKEVESIADLTPAVKGFKVGDTTTVVVYRSRKLLELTITFGERPHENNTNTEVPEPSGDMPSSGDYKDWFDYFFGDGND